MMLEHYNQTGYQVAVHVRRGDVGAEMPNSDKFKFDILSRSRRFAKDEVYLEVVRQVEARACLLSVLSKLKDFHHQTMDHANSNSCKNVGAKTESVSVKFCVAFSRHFLFFFSRCSRQNSF